MVLFPRLSTLFALRYEWPLDPPFINLLSDWISSRPVTQHLVNGEPSFSNRLWSTSCLLTSISLPSCFRPVLTSVLQKVPVPSSSSSLQLPALRRPELQLPDLLQQGKSPGICQEQTGMLHTPKAWRRERKVEICRFGVLDWTAM